MSKSYIDLQETFLIYLQKCLCFYSDLAHMLCDMLNIFACFVHR